MDDGCVVTPPFVDRRAHPPAADERLRTSGGWRTSATAPCDRRRGIRPRRVLESVVDGSGRGAYRAASASTRARSDQPIVSTSCTCPVQSTASTRSRRCSRATGSRRGRRTSRRQTASWRAVLAPPSARAAAAHDALALGVELRQRVRRGASAWAPVRVETATPRGLHQFGVRRARRPPPARAQRPDRRLDQGRRVSWDALRRPSTATTPPRRAGSPSCTASAATCACSARSPTPRSGSRSTTSSQPALAAPGDRGGPRHPARPDQEAHDGRARGRGDVAVRAERTARRPRARRRASRSTASDAVGSPRSGAAARSAIVGRLPLRRAARAHRAHAGAGRRCPIRCTRSSTARDAVTVPADDADGVPARAPAAHRPARRGRGAGHRRCPRPSGPTLVVTVRFAPAHRLDYALAWRYGDARAARRYRGDRAADRDHGAEERDPRRASRRSGRDAGARRLRRDRLAVGDRRRRVRRRGCCPRSRPLDDVDGRDPRASARATASSPATRTSTIIDGRDHRPGLVRPRASSSRSTGARSRSRRCSPRSRGAAQAAPQRRALLLARASRRCSGCATSSRRPASSTEWETGPRISRYQTALWADFEDLADEARARGQLASDRGGAARHRADPADAAAARRCARSCAPTSAPASTGSPSSGSTGSAASSPTTWASARRCSCSR